MSSASVARPADPLSAVRGLKSVLARQGTIVASYRTYLGRKLGPYYRLIYRDAGRQCSLYLGKSEKILAQVRRLLEEFQKPLQIRRSVMHAAKTAEADLKRHMAQLRIDLLRAGPQLHGYSVRGWRRYRALRRTGWQPVLHPKLHARLLRLLSIQPPMRGPTLSNCPFASPADQKTPPSLSSPRFSEIT